jgi:hypothetical protein
LIFLLLLVNYTQTEVDLIGLFEIWLHSHHLGEGFFGMFQRPVAIVKDADAIPQFRFLRNSLVLIKQWLESNEPWGHGDGTELADMLNMLAGGRPSLGSNGLVKHKLRELLTLNIRTYLVPPMYLHY